MLETAEDLLSRNSARAIFLDGRPFSRAIKLKTCWPRPLPCISRGGFSNVFARMRPPGADLRLTRKTREHPAGNRDYQLYLEVKSRFEAIIHAKSVIDTEQPFEICMQQALAALRAI